ncbi:phosphate ABC transporter substrate-binding protein [Mariniblastus sp.]|nr:phosphate ABC transporter substrate-binding protein [Mariniblastus sp.]
MIDIRSQLEAKQLFTAAALNFRTFVLFCLSVCTIGCANDDSGQQVKLVLSGSSTIGPLVSEIGKRYEELHPDVRIDVQTGGSSRGIRDAKDGLADIGMSSRALKDSETEGRQAWPIAMDGVCFIVNAKNSVGELTREQLTGVLKGEIQNWNQVGGADAPIEFINRAAGRSELELVSKFFDVAPSEMKADLIAGENQQGIKNVTNTPNSISYMSVGASEEAIRLESPIRMLPLSGIEASVKNVESGTFPLSRPLILVTGDAPPEAAINFIKYCQSDDVADLVRELSYVPIPK